MNRKIVAVLIIVCTAVLASVGYYLSKPSSANIRLGYLLGDLHQVALPVALENGYFTQEHLNVSLVGPFTGGPALMKAFAAGELDIGYVGTAPALIHAAKGVRVQILASVNAEGSALIVREGVSSLTDLKGGIVAIPMIGSMQDVLLRMAFSRVGMSYKDLTILEIRPSDMPAQLETKRIDGYIAWEPYCSQSVVSGIGKVLTSSREIWPDHPCCVLVASKGFISRQPDAVERVVRAHVKATRFVQDHPQDAMAIGAKFTGLNSSVIEEAWPRISFDFVPKVDETKMLVEKLIELEMIGRSELPDTSRFVADVINAEFLKRVT